MTEIKQKALALVNEVREKRGIPLVDLDDVEPFSWFTATCRAIEQHEAFRREVSDSVERAVDDCGHDGLRKAYIHSRFFHFITPKPDPLVEAIKACNMATLDGIEDAVASDLRAALTARGLKIVEDK